MIKVAHERLSSGTANNGWWKPAVGLLTALILPFVPLGKLIAPERSISALLIRESVWWGYALFVVAWLLFVERKSLASIGFRRPNWRSLVVAAIATIALLAILISEFALIIPLFHLSGAEVINARAQIMETPYWCRVLTVLRAAVVEEILFRAYLMEKVYQLTGSWASAVITSVLAFTLAHLSTWGFVHLVAVFGAAIVFALLYVWRRDTVSNMIAHFLTDAAGFLMS